MRIKLEFSLPTKPISVNNQDLVNSYVHNVLGRNNEFHDTKSNYCVSPLCGGKLNYEDKTLSFTKAPFIIISSSDDKFMTSFLVGLQQRLKFNDDMELIDKIFIKEDFYNGWNHFFTLSPVLLKTGLKGEKTKFITIEDENYSVKLKEQIINKLSKINPNLDLTDFEILIDASLKKVRKVLVKNVINRASSIKISIKTNKEVAELLYNLGLGQSTGSGFGCIYKTENNNLYKY